MKIAIFGTTLYAGVIASLLAECGHYVFVCDDLEDESSFFDITEQDVLSTLAKHLQSGF